MTQSYANYSITCSHDITSEAICIARWQCEQKDKPDLRVQEPTALTLQPNKPTALAYFSICHWKPHDPNYIILKTSKGYFGVEIQSPDLLRETAFRVCNSSEDLPASNEGVQWQCPYEDKVQPANFEFPCEVGYKVVVEAKYGSTECFVDVKISELDPLSARPAEDLQKRLSQGKIRTPSANEDTLDFRPAAPPRKKSVDEINDFLNS